jgi:hypothetical protein
MGVGTYLVSKTASEVAGYARPRLINKFLNWFRPFDSSQVVVELNDLPSFRFNGETLSYTLDFSIGYRNLGFYEVDLRMVSWEINQDAYGFLKEKYPVNIRLKPGESCSEMATYKLTEADIKKVRRNFAGNTLLRVSCQLQIEGSTRLGPAYISKRFQTAAWLLELFPET